MYSSQLLKGTFQTIILNLLNENEKMYGYEISQKVKEGSNGDISLPEGSLYPILHKMTEDGLLKTEKVTIGRRVRRYYSLTTTGTQQAELKVKEFGRFVETMKMLLGPNLGLS